MLSFKLSLETVLKQLDHDPDINVSESEWLVVELITMKLPKEADEFLFNLNKTMYYSLDQIKDGLRVLINYLDTQDEKRLPSERQPKMNSKSSNAASDNNNVSVPSQSNSTAIGTYSATTTFNNCFYCGKGHKPYACTEYCTISSRKERLRALRRCTLCTKSHDTESCDTVLKLCRLCEKGKHHVFLCVNTKNNKSNQNKSSTDAANMATSNKQSSVPTTRDSGKGGKKPKPMNDSQVQGDNYNPNSQVVSTTLSVKPNTNYSVALATATVQVRSDCGKTVEARAFFDGGSQRSFMRLDLADQLQLKGSSKVNMTLDSFNDSGVQKTYEVVRPVVSLGGRRKRLTMLVVESMPQQISTPGILETAQRLNRSGYKLADKHITSDTVEDIKLLIGSDFFGRYVSGMTRVDNIDLLESPGGHLIYGQIPNYVDSNPVSCTNSLIAEVLVRPSDISSNLAEPRTVGSRVVDEIPPVHQLWELDVMGINPTQESFDDVKSLSHYESTVKHDGERYWVELPFKTNHPSLPNNFKLALGQMYSQRKKFLEKPDLLNCYNRVIKEQLSLGFIEEVKNPVVGPSTHYLPHHGVAKASVTTPLRVVYNCSAKIGKFSASLNDCLMKGPSLTEKLQDVLIKFRTKKYAYVADIEKAFLQVGLQEHHRDYTRFLWPRDPFDDDSEIVTYRFRAVLFGANCSPFLLQMTLNHHFQHSESPYAGVLSSSFYVDNLQGVSNSEMEMLNIYKEANSELKKAGMTLNQWNSNSPALKERITEDFNQTQELVDAQNVLGLDWDVLEDTISLKNCDFSKLEFVTKRQLLSLVSMCFDPLGLCCPILIKGKLLIQSAWKEKVGWDVRLPPSYLNKWRELAIEIKQLPSFKFPRSVCGVDSDCKLHVFVDASTSAFGAVAYVVSTSGAHLLAAKARVAPLKERTLPQLELTALQLGTQFAVYLNQVLNEFNIVQTITWSDSEAALQWLRNGNSKITYVQNRVKSIRELGVGFQFLHVPTKENPADLVTRGISLKQFKKSTLWLHGPEWLSDCNSWPSQKQYVMVSEIIAEPMPQVPKVEPILDLSKFSSLSKLLSVTSYIFKFVRMCKPNVSLPTASVYWMRHVQALHFPSVYKSLQTGDVAVDGSSKQLIKDLGLYLDESSGLVRSRGRLHHSSLPDGAKFPILIPTKSHLAYLIISAHERSLHGGTQETLMLVRKHYWMPKCRQRVKTLVSKCVVCKRVEGKKYGYPGPPPLPLERVQYTRPFSQVGIDYSGPITLTKTEDGLPHKYYVCLFTCCATRLVHLELACDMSAITFVNCFRRFCAIYSTPSVVISDNGSNFVASAKFFSEVMDHPQVEKYMKDHNIVWKFIAPRAPWQGGFYERMIGLTKSALKKTLFKKRVSSDELHTILKEIQGRINNRPLTYVDEESVIEPLTPAHLLYGRTTCPMPSREMEDPRDPDYLGHEELNSRYHHLCAIVNRFSRVWKNDYLTSLREKHYGARKSIQLNPPKVNDVVIVESVSAQHEWPLGRIVKTYPDSEGNIRAVDVLCKGSISKRTLDKLVPLEISGIDALPNESANVENTSDLSENVNNTNNQSGRPVRQAAQRATKLRQDLIDNAQL